MRMSLKARSRLSSAISFSALSRMISAATFTNASLLSLTPSSPSSNDPSAKFVCACSDVSFSTALHRIVRSLANSTSTCMFMLARRVCLSRRSEARACWSTSRSANQTSFSSACTLHTCSNRALSFSCRSVWLSADWTSVSKACMCLECSRRSWSSCLSSRSLSTTIALMAQYSSSSYSCLSSASASVSTLLLGSGDISRGRGEGCKGAMAGRGAERRGRSRWRVTLGMGRTATRIARRAKRSEERVSW
mmetsp:Transcript_42609/g.69099  ORF Transcript_42609/g.69099 Transcript_42609/m.69099 type:complete len:249 (-) Transcript_42609:65-811(-)